jgi:hypothetical protein
MPIAREWYYISMSKKVTTKKKPKAKKNVLFVQSRGSYIPASPFGWLLYIPFTMYLVLVLLVAIYGTDSAAEAIVISVPGFVAGGAVMQWIASSNS